MSAMTFAADVATEVLVSDPHGAPEAVRDQLAAI